MDGRVAVALFRHGATLANLSKAYLGWTDSPLCLDAVSGIQAQKHKLPNYELIFSSDLGRCLQTAEILFPGPDVTPLAEFREMHFGLWEGKIHQELEGDNEYQAWMANMFQAGPPGGEAYSQFCRRVDRGWKQLRERMADSGAVRSALVTHGGVVRVLLEKYAPVKKNFWEWHVPHGSGLELEWTSEGFRRGERCILLREVFSTEKEHG